VYLGTPYGVPVGGINCGCLVEELVATVMGAFADHCGGDACDEGTRFGS
jgi:hypothetical protein